MIETINLVKEYNNNKAVNNASVKIENGNIYGFIGKNGAGKTTFIRMIAGLIFPSSGEIIINGGIITGSGINAHDIGEVYGVMKAYSSRVGAGPFVTEQDNQIGDLIRELGHEYGATTKRPRRRI